MEKPERQTDTFVSEWLPHFTVSERYDLSDTATVPQVMSPAMSVLVAVDCGSHMVMAADTLVTNDTGLRKTAEKLHQIPNQPLVYGCTGDDGIGRQFAEWFDAWVWPTDATWRSVADRAAEELSTLNGRKRELVRLSGLQETPNDVASVLMAGYVAGSPDIFEITDRGAVSSQKHDRVVALGSGQVHAMMAYYTLLAFHKEGLEHNDVLATNITRIAANHAPLCSYPVTAFRIDSSGVSRIGKPVPGEGP